MRSVHKEKVTMQMHIKDGLKKSNPAAIVVWAFMQIQPKSGKGLTSRRIINFLKKRYRLIGNPANTGKSISSILKCAVEFGLLEKRQNRYFLA